MICKLYETEVALERHYSVIQQFKTVKHSFASKRCENILNKTNVQTKMLMKNHLLIGIFIEQRIPKCFVE